MPIQTPPLLLRAEEAAELLGLGRSKVFKMLASGELPAVRIGRSVRIRRADIEQWVEAQAIGPHANESGEDPNGH